MSRHFRIMMPSVLFVALLVAPGCDNQQSLLDEATLSRIPPVTGAKSLSKHYVEVSFETTANPSAELPQRYSITAESGDVLAVQAAQLTENRMGVILTTDDQLPIPYQLRMDLATGTSRSSAAAADGSLDSGGVTFLGTEFGEPAISSAVALGNTLVLVTYDTRMNKALAEFAGFYRISDPDLNIISASLSADEVSLVLTTSPQEDLEYHLKVTNVKSSAGFGGFLIDPTRNAATFQGISPVDTTAPRLVQAEALDYSSVRVSFSEPLENHANDVANYAVAPELTVLGVSFNEWNTQATLHVLPMTAGVDYTLAVSRVEDRSSNVINPAFASAMFGIPANEMVAPQLLSASSITSTTVLLTFSEPMSDNAGDPTKYTFDPMLIVVGAQLSEFKTQVTLTTLPQIAGTEYTVTVADVSDSVGNVIDPAMDSAMFTYLGATNDPAFVALKPRVVGAIATSDTTVVVSFNKPMDESADEATNYFITGPETVFLFVTEALRSTDGTQVRLVTSPQADYDYTVQVVGVRDIFGNSIPAPDGIFTSPTGYDPSKAIFRGLAPDSIDKQIDTDGDEFADWFETAGWEILIGLANGGVKRAFVTSDPYNPDTDGDGFDDGDENAHNWDPRTDDTDADQLTDGDEFNLWYSDPADQDSDNDGIDDLTEVTFFRTSPILADTDGDGFSDDSELFEVNRNPRVADLPVPTITTGNVRLQIDERYTFVDSTGTSQTEESSTSTTLQQTDRTASNRTDTNSTETIWEAGLDTELGFEGGPAASGNGGARGFVALFSPHFQWSQGTEDTTEISTESSRESQSAYESSLTKGREFTTSQEITREIAGARLDVDLTIENGSDVAFTLSNMQLSVLQPGLTRGRFVPVATLVPNSQLITGNDLSINIGPLDPERGPIIFTSTDVFPNLVEDLMRAPHGLIVKLANFDLIDEAGRNFAFIQQDVNDKTANITVNYGDGTVDRYQVAVNGGLDTNFILGGRCDYNMAIVCFDDADCDTIGTCMADHCTNAPEVECEDDGDCTLSGACEAQSVGGFDDFGLTRGLPLDFVLHDILGLVKNPTDPDAIVAGFDGMVTTVAEGDDIQVVPVATTGLPDRTVVVFAGQNGVLDTPPNNGIPAGDDTEAFTAGYEMSRTCNAATDDKIIEPLLGGDGIANTTAALDDVQMIAVGAAAGAGATVIAPGPNGRIDSVPNVDDEFSGPGDLCMVDGDCPGGACNGREVLRRFKNSPTGLPNRFWFAISTERIPVGADLGRHIMKPGESLTLSFGQDVDRDGLFATEEFLYGSSDNLKDTDADRLGDFAEVRVGWQVEVAGRTPFRAYPDPRVKDSDADGVRDDVEMRCETDPRKRDTDGDELNDAEELDCGTCCNPFIPGLCAGFRQYCSTDADCLALGQCWDATLTVIDETEFCDVDGDCLADGDQFVHCLHTQYFGMCTESCTDVCPPPAVVPFPPVHLNPRNRDTDGDGVFDGREIEIGSDPLNPFDAADFRDTDEDGLTDKQETDGWDVTIVLCSNSHPNAFNNDCNDTGMPADAAYGTDCADCGPRVLMAEAVVSSPSDADTDFDGLPDLVERAIGTHPDEQDTDGDGLSDYDEFNRFGEFLRFNFEFAGFFLSDAASQKLGTNPLSQDSDGDELSDDFELLTGWKVLDSQNGMVRDVFSSPLFLDSDLDGANDQKEFRGGDFDPIGDGDATDPMDPDTDGDQRLDGEEFGRSNPLVPDIFVTVTLWQLRNIDGPDDSDSGVLSDEWQFNLDVRRPNQGLSQRLMDQASLVDLVPGLGIHVTHCVLNDVWQEIPGAITWFQISRQDLDGGVSVSFGLPIGDAVVLEGGWSEIDSCTPAPPGGLPTYNTSCFMQFQEVIQGTMLTPGAFITKTVTLTSMAPFEVCSATLDFEIVVE